jgi:hypothetical protein
MRGGSGLRGDTREKDPNYSEYDIHEKPGLKCQDNLIKKGPNILDRSPINRSFFRSLFGNPNYSYLRSRCEASFE